MTKRLQKRIAYIIAVCLLCALMSGYVSVDRDSRGAAGSFEKLPVYVDGVLEYTGYIVNGTAYVPLRSFCSALNMGAVVTWNSGSNTMYASFEEAVVTEKVVQVEVPVTPAPTVVPAPAETTPEILDVTQIPAETPALAGEVTVTPVPVEAPAAAMEPETDAVGLGEEAAAEEPAEAAEPATMLVEQVVTETTYKSHTLSAEVGEFYMYVNDRVIYLGADVLNYCGNVLVPLSGLCQAFGITASADSSRDGLVLSTDGLKVCKRGSEVYNSEDLYWLSRIINAEAGNQSMEGRICVGNVVQNRVADERFADSVKGVIFTKNQFCTVTSGTVYYTPDADSVTAAKLCLEGVKLAGDSTYFVNPKTGATAWFRNNLTFYGSVGDHDFYY